jgi:hypothetical protein
MYRIVQWTTGNVGRRSLAAILEHPDLELIGCYAYTPAKADRDVGELSGGAPVGIKASHDIDALLALQPDCVVYTPKFFDIAEVERILRSGANIVTTSWFLTGHWLGEERARIELACWHGRSSMFGSGVNPGFSDMMAMASTAVCDRVDKVTLTEMADATGYDSPETEQPMGFGLPVTDPELPATTKSGTAYFVDRVHLVAAALGVDLDEVRFEADYAATTQDLDLGSWKIAAGCVAGMDYRWLGVVGGRTVIELRSRLIKGNTLDPGWTIDHGLFVEVEGRPTVKVHIQILPPNDFTGTTPGDYMGLFMTATAMPALNAIPAVVAAEPGIVTYNDLPLMASRGAVS